MAKVHLADILAGTRSGLHDEFDCLRLSVQSIDTKRKRNRRMEKVEFC
jgi:hypothetical protein